MFAALIAVHSILSLVSACPDFCSADLQKIAENAPQIDKRRVPNATYQISSKDQDDAPAVSTYRNGALNRPKRKSRSNCTIFRDHLKHPMYTPEAVTAFFPVNTKLNGLSMKPARKTRLAGLKALSITLNSNFMTRNFQH